ncbi:MAG: OB-fold domain-containing protein [Myxococcota bacterium]
MPPEHSFIAPHVVEYPYRRSVGPVLGRFFTSLRDGRIEGIRTAAGRVLVPPMEYDPETGEATGEFVEVGSVGEVTTWSWVARPRPKHPLDRPFAWALVRLDGADTALLHAVDAGDESQMRTGMRVRARFRAERKGEIQDIECFDPEDHQA